MKHFLATALLLPVFAFALTPEELDVEKKRIAAMLDATSTCSATYLVYMEALYDAGLGREEQKKRMDDASARIEALERYQTAVIEHEVALINQHRDGRKTVTFQELEQRTLQKMHDAEQALKAEVENGRDINAELTTCNGISSESAARMSGNHRLEMDVTPEQQKRMTNAENRVGRVTRCGVVMEQNHKQNNGEYNHIRVRTWSTARAMGRMFAEMIVEYDPSIAQKDAETYVSDKMNRQANLSAENWAAADDNGQLEQVQYCLQLDKAIRGKTG